MNWYFQIKLAQLSMSIDQDEIFFEDLMLFIYELEYKLSMLRTKPFSGMERRRENIINRLEEEQRELHEQAFNILYQTISKWLQDHALTDPEQWASGRSNDPMYDTYMEDYSSEMAIESLAHEYFRYAYPAQHKRQAPRNFVWNTFSRDLIPFANNLESISDYLKDEYGNGEIEMQLDNLHENGLEQFNLQHNSSFQSEEEAEDWIENSYVQEADFSDIVYSMFDSPEGFAGVLKHGYEMGYLEPQKVISELYQKMVFPLWYEFWQQEGIDETREAVENIFAKMEQARQSQDSGLLSSAINLAINAVHQNGSMLEHLEYGGADTNMSTDQMLDFFRSFHEEDNKYIEKWNEELREIGVQI